MKQTLSLKLTNKLVLTISLKQQLTLLLLPKVELEQTIKAELEENPFLEELTNIEEEYEPKLVDLATPSFDEDDFTLDKRLAYKPTFLDSLELQISLEFEGKQLQIAKEIIGNLDEKGLLAIDVEEIAKKLNLKKQEVETVRQKIKNLEPTGIASKTIEEAIYTQYLELFGEDQLAKSLIYEDLYNLNNLDYLKDKYKVDEETLKEKICNIKSLKPYPTYGLDIDETKYIEPDIFIYDLGDRFEIKINEIGIPKIKLTNQYKRLISKKELPEETRKFLEEKLQKAIGIVKGIQQRRENLKKIVNILVKRQEEFLRKGKQYLKPLTLKDIANEVGLHESTVSRIVSNKYAYTPIGTIPLKSFFATKLKTKEGEVSTEKVKHLIKQLIEEENKTKPLSDEAISKILRKDFGIRIARRTVAKYREELNIPDSRKRRVAK
ncbi:MAG: RNA polymerase sigma-54 factor [Hydrogenothermus sp.]|nr:MAG: RNA polymerase sigma-54 factor [Hydrogenothermus sp.]